MWAVAGGEPLLDELGELTLERLVDELLELGTVQLTSSRTCSAIAP